MLCRTWNVPNKAVPNIFVMNVPSGMVFITGLSLSDSR
jgi:hypothetical protein